MERGLKIPVSAVRFRGRATYSETRPTWLDAPTGMEIRSPISGLTGYNEKVQIFSWRNAQLIDQLFSPLGEGQKLPATEEIITSSQRVSLHLTVR